MKLKKVWVICLLLALIFSLATGLIACGKPGNKEEAQYDGKNVITIGYLPITHALPVFEEAELLKAEAEQAPSSETPTVIKLQKFSSWPDLTDALNAGKIDGASVLIELAMSAVSKGIGLKAVALGHKDGNVIVASNDIETPADLKGKTFAIPSTQSSHNILLEEMLRKNGMEREDINVVQLAPTEMPSSLVSGAIDAYCVAEPFGAQAISKDLGHVLYRSEELWQDSCCCALVLSDTFLQNRPGDVTFLIEKYYEGAAKIDYEEALHLAENYLGQEESVLETSLQWIRYQDLAISREAYESLAQKVKDYGINENPPTYDEFIYSVE